jgi:hypothetical protein
MTSTGPPPPARSVGVAALGVAAVDMSIILAPWVVRPSLVPAFGPGAVDMSIILAG